MTLNLERCDAAALHRWGWAARGVGDGHPTFETAARALTRCFYDALQADGPDGPSRACALVRCYKTHPYRTLPDDLQREAIAKLRRDDRPPPGMRCVTLLASAGDEPAWNSRHDAGGHMAIPLPTAEAVARWPMIARLAADFGLEPADLVEPSPDMARRRRGRNYGICLVPEALGSAVIPGQAAIVRRPDIRSVLAFGGMLSTGDLFAVVLFCRMLVSSAVAEQFRALALHVKSMLFAFGEHDAFDPTSPPAGARETAS